MSDGKFGCAPDQGWAELLAEAKAMVDAMTPTDRAIMCLRQQVGYVAAEMTMAQIHSALILAELDRREAEIRRLADRVRELERALEALCDMAETWSVVEGKKYIQLEHSEAYQAALAVLYRDKQNRRRWVNPK